MGRGAVAVIQASLTGLLGVVAFAAIVAGALVFLCVRLEDIE